VFSLCGRGGKTVLICPKTLFSFNFQTFELMSEPIKNVQKR